MAAYAIGRALGPRNLGERRLARALERSPLTLIDRTSDGALAKIVGTVAGIDPPLRPPFSEESCVLYGASLHRSDSATPVATLRAREPAGELVREIRGQDFIVDAGTSKVRVVVDPDRTHLLGDTTTQPGSEHADRPRRF